MMSSHKKIVFIDVSSVQQNDNSSVMDESFNEDKPTAIINENKKSELSTINEHEINTILRTEKSSDDISQQAPTNDDYLPKTTITEKNSAVTTTTMITSTENEKYDNRESQQPHQERNGSFKFSTTAYCGNCREELDEEFIGSSCRKCLKRADDVDSKYQQQDNTNSLNTISTTTSNCQENPTSENQQQQQQEQCQNISDNKLHKEQLQIQIEDNPTSVLGASNPSPKSLDCPTMIIPLGAPTSTVGSINSERICRICLDSVDEGDLIAPCKCSGSTKYAHESCLLKWFFKSSKKTCEVCLGNVNVKPIGFKPVQEVSVFFFVFVLFINTYLN